MNTPQPSVPSPELIRLTHLIYGLHALSVGAGIIGAATVVGMMVTGWPSIIAVVLNYIKRSEANGTWLESHFRWQIRTFWFAFLWAVISVILIITVIGMIVGIPLMFVVGIWVIYRVARGWMKLSANEAMPI
ncbi:MAG: hypothetical protein J0M12_12425 [Deltaproteobacteria bacterium]|nr:hypothetical protein [Deltaproteobacteria bacterium]